MLSKPLQLKWWQLSISNSRLTRFPFPLQSSCQYRLQKVLRQQKHSWLYSGLSGNWRSQLAHLMCFVFLSHLNMSGAASLQFLQMPPTFTIGGARSFTPLCCLFLKSIGGLLPSYSYSATLFESESPSMSTSEPLSMKLSSSSSESSSSS